jgi:hypothetical protein
MTTIHETSMNLLAAICEICKTSMVFAVIIHVAAIIQLTQEHTPHIIIVVKNQRLIDNWETDPTMRPG